MFFLELTWISKILFVACNSFWKLRRTSVQQFLRRVRGQTPFVDRGMIGSVLEVDSLRETALNRKTFFIQILEKWKPLIIWFCIEYCDFWSYDKWYFSDIVDDQFEIENQSIRIVATLRQMFRFETNVFFKSDTPCNKLIPREESVPAVSRSWISA